MDNIINNDTNEYKSINNVTDSLDNFDTKEFLIHISFVVGAFCIGLLCFFCSLFKLRDRILEDNIRNDQGMEMQQAPVYEGPNTAHRRRRRRRYDDNPTANYIINDERDETSTTSDSGDAAAQHDITGTVTGIIYKVKAENIVTRNIEDDRDVRFNVEGGNLNPSKDEGSTSSSSGVKSTNSEDTAETVEVDSLSKSDTASVASGASSSLGGRDSATPLF